MASFNDVREKCVAREQARKGQDFATGDLIRNELSQLGVVLDDAKHQFTMADGTKGSYNLYAVAAAPVTFADVQAKCVSREEARKGLDWNAADEIRGELAKMGVILEDAKHLFTMPDGTKGSYNLYDLSRPKMSFEDAHAKCVAREEARKINDYTTADSIRKALQEVAVVLDDKAKIFTMPDGAKGSFDLDRPSTGPVPSPAAVPMLSSSGIVSLSQPAVAADFNTAKAMCIEREESRKANDWATADSIREELTNMGVTLDDQKHLFTLPDGTKGSYNLYDVARASMSMEEAQAKCLEREEARKKLDYTTGDAIRDELAKVAIVLDDKSKTFTMPDGQKGSYDISGGEPRASSQSASAPMIGQPMMMAQPAMLYQMPGVLPQQYAAYAQPQTAGVAQTTAYAQYLNQVLAQQQQYAMAVAAAQQGIPGYPMVQQQMVQQQMLPQQVVQQPMVQQQASMMQAQLAQQAQYAALAAQYGLNSQPPAQPLDDTDAKRQRLV